MNTELFISKKISKNKNGFSKPIVNIAILGIGLGLAVMIITIAVVTGFQKEIRDKVIGFGSHIQIINYDNNDSFEGTSIDKNQAFLNDLKKDSSILHIQSFITKVGILKKKGELQGIVAKGIGKDFNWNFFNKNICEGSAFVVSDSAKSDKILISRFHADKLNLKLNDSVLIYFIQNNKQAAARFVICGIYQTGLGDLFDQVYVIIDMAQIQKLNNWSRQQIGGFEIVLKEYEKINEVTKNINEKIGFNFLAKNTKELNNQIFSWLDAEDINAMVVISLMGLVAAINMISVLLILILERTQMIGLIKVLGMTNKNVRKIFLYNASLFIGKGLVIGNIIGISLCLLQKYFHIFSLDPTTYYLSYIPINFNLTHILFLNLGTFALCLVMLWIPSYIITYITPVKAMRYN